MEINDITVIIIEESIRIHNDLGPGLLESVYEEILFYRLNKRATNPNSVILRRSKNGCWFQVGSHCRKQSNRRNQIRRINCPRSSKDIINLSETNRYNCRIIDQLQ